MPLAPGTTIGHYRIVCAIGAGGMGQVYRAQDTRLKRDVALKVLPEVYAKDRERLIRITREAELLASLNHTNIATIYGVEEGSLVMELVEGESPRGPMTFDAAWRICAQVASARPAGMSIIFAARHREWNRRQSRFFAGHRRNAGHDFAGRTLDRVRVL